MTKRKRKNKRKKKLKKSKKLKRKIKRRKSKRKKKLNKITKTKNLKSNELIFKVPKKWSNSAYANKKNYEKKYKLSIADNEGFWRKEGKRITWIKPYTKVKDIKYSKTDVKIKWFYDGKLNGVNLMG